MIKIKNLRKSYTGKPILNDVNIEIPRGKVVSLIGPNGAGKSTLLSIIARLEKSDLGLITIDNMLQGDYSLDQLSKKISFLRQHNFFDVRLRVSELVSYGRFPYCKGKMNDKEFQKVNEALQMMNLMDLKDVFIDELSGGQRQRAFLAMVIAQDTEYVLLDEPLNNLDMKHAVEIMNTARALVEKLGKTVIAVIHDINFAINYSDYIIGMKEGEIIFQNHTANILKEEILEEIFGITFRIVRDQNCTLCNYYNK